eukprot:TRINITY_DN34484_c0_g1_i1.p1 TRINITY_DN34484_c0_g1~~TRINITY_DN34484_c0_g1_i1.p1  ORF type:complete len:279 (-),score=21.05 TRINITY_DN34484_c0_g1_i1:75-911(-)
MLWRRSCVSLLVVSAFALINAHRIREESLRPVPEGARWWTNSFMIVTMCVRFFDAPDFDRQQCLFKSLKRKKPTAAMLKVALEACELDEAALKACYKGQFKDAYNTIQRYQTNEAEKDHTEPMIMTTVHEILGNYSRNPLSHPYMLAFNETFRRYRRVYRKFQITEELYARADAFATLVSHDGMCKGYEKVGVKFSKAEKDVCRRIQGLWQHEAKRAQFYVDRQEAKVFDIDNPSSDGTGLLDTSSYAGSTARMNVLARVFSFLNVLVCVGFLWRHIE